MGEKKHDYFFLEGGGECGQLVRDLDWAATPLGSPEEWPAVVKSLVKMILDSPVAMCLFLGPEYVQVYNNALIPSLGTTRHPLNMGKPAQLTSQAWDFVGPMFEKIMGGGSQYLNEITLTLNKNGYEQECTMDLSYTPVYTENGVIAGIHCTVIEKTDKLKAMAELQASEARFRDMLMQSPVAIGLLRGREFVVESANATLLTLWGKTEDIVGMPILQALPEIEGQVFVPLLESVYETGVPYYGNAVLAHLKHDNEMRDQYFDFVYAPIKDGEGAINGVLVTASDVTSQVLAKRATEDSEQRFRSLIEEAPVATALYTGRELRIEVANDIMINYWGKGKSALGKTLEEALPELDGQAFLQVLDNVYTTGETAEFKATRVDLNVNGELTTFYFDFTYKALLNSAGEVYGILNMAIDVTGQVQAKWQLEKSQQQLLAYFEQTPVAIAVLSKEDLTFRIANPFYGELVGRRPDEIENKPLLEALPELKGQGFDLLLEQVVATGVAYHASEVKVDLMRNGRIESIYVNLTYQPQRDVRGEITGILVVATDITQHVLAREKVEKSEARIKTIIAAAPFAISLFTGSDFIIETANDAFLKMVGKDTAVVGVPLAVAIPEIVSEAQPFIEFLKNVYQTGKAFQVLNFAAKFKRDGVLAENYYDIIYTPLVDDAQSVYAILATSTDVTEKRNALAKIEEADAALRGAVELAGLATWTLDIAEQKLIYSPRFMEWLGFSEDAKKLPEAYDPLPDEYKESVPKALAASIASETGMYDNIHPIINHKTGQKRIIHAQGQVFYDNKGNPVQLRGTAQDITLQQELQLALRHEVQKRTEELAAAIEELQVTNEEIEQANHNLLRSNDELSQYAYVASHDLQEPLRKIMVFSDILKSKGSLSAEHRQIVEKIAASSARMSLLIKDLLEFSRLIKSDKMMRPVDINQTVRDVIADFELVAAEKKARITCGMLPRIDAVALQMNQLFYNIIGNALKFVAENTTPEISISARQLTAEELTTYMPRPKSKGIYYDIMVKDNGIGFDVSFSEQIFEVFKRLHGRDVYPGSGIGLALCRRIVTNHDGYLYPESSIGNGTTFHIILPVHNNLN